MKKVVVIWFRQDLRLADNPALTAAVASCVRTGAALLPLFISDALNPREWQRGAASALWLHHGLHNLNVQLHGALRVFSVGEDQAFATPEHVFLHIQQVYDVQAVLWNRCYEPWRMQRDMGLKAFLKEQGITAESFNGSLLWEPWEVQKKDGSMYKVFTPFYRKGCLALPPPRQPLPLPDLECVLPMADEKQAAHAIDQLWLTPRIPWDKPMLAHWDISETGAQQRLQDFVQHGVQNYKEGRNFPAASNVSRLSPYLHFGQISPHQAWYAVRDMQGQGMDPHIDHFCSELGWREFSYHLLYHRPELPQKNLQPKFDHFPWQWPDTSSTQAAVQRWQQGRTGFPIIDAGMRELWQTGYMHNRVRMIVASFLVKNMRVHWHVGAKWFWDCLFDADLANNSASWQWVAGCGADAAPYFRIFNPITQSQKFDPQGAYIKTYCPELARLPDQYVHAPWQASPLILQAAGLTLGQNYPEPMLDLAATRQQALAALESTKAPPSTT